MPSSHGKFVWHELMTTDPDAASQFYTRVAGLTPTRMSLPGMDYTVLNAGSTGVGGIMRLPEGMPAPPHWIGYIYVDDVDGHAARVTEAGGAVHRAPSDIPGVGRFAVVADPQGAAFMIFKPNPEPENPPAPPAMGTPGTFAWNELMAADGPTAYPFYARLFGWTETGDHDMGPMGIYKTFEANGSAGGLMTKPPHIPVPVWQYYISVEDIDAAASRLTAAGGQVLNGPHQVPGGTWILNATDPQGAHISFSGPRHHA